MLQSCYYILVRDAHRGGWVLHAPRARRRPCASTARAAPLSATHRPAPIGSLQGCDINHDYQGVNNAYFRCEDSKMRQNGGNHAIRRRKLPLKKVLPWVLPTFWGDLPFWGRYVGYMSVTQVN